MWWVNRGAGKPYAVLFVASLSGCAQDRFVTSGAESCPSDADRVVLLSDDVEGDDVEGSGVAALASFDTVTVSTDDAASLDLPASTFDLRAEGNAEVYAMPDCGDGVWFGRWILAQLEGDGGWGHPDWGGGDANFQAAVDETTGDWYYVAHLFRTWVGGPPLDAYGVEAGDRIGLYISNHTPQRVADGSGIDPTAPHWTLLRTEYPDEHDMGVRLASGSVTFLSPADP